MDIDFDKPNSEQVMLVRESYGHICYGTDLLDRFYEIFLASSPAISKIFTERQVDLEVQKGLLRHGLGLAVFFAMGDPVGEKGLRRIRVSHSEDGMNISPFLYVFWVESLLQAIREQEESMGHACSDALIGAWEAVLDYTVAYIASGCAGGEGGLDYAAA